MSDTKPWYAKFEAEKTREMLRDFKLQVKAFFTPSDYTREAFSTVSRLYVIWMAFVILINFTSGVFSWVDHEWNEGFLYFLISALFGIIFLDRLTLNMAEKIIKSLLTVSDDQQKMLREMLDEQTTGREFD